MRAGHVRPTSRQTETNPPLRHAAPTAGAALVAPPVEEAEGAGLFVPRGREQRLNLALAHVAKRLLLEPLHVRHQDDPGEA